MAAKKQTTSARLDEAIQEMAKSLYDVGAMDQVTLRQFDIESIPKVKELSPQEIKKIRLKEKESQPIFARFLNTTVSTVRQWEQGDKHPRGTSLKLLNMVASKGLQVLH